MSDILRQYNIHFVNRNANGRNTKNVTGGLSISIWLHDMTSRAIDDAVADINQCINGQSLDDSWTWDSDRMRVDITPKGARFWGDERGGNYHDVPLNDLKEILLEYKKFLQTPPFHGEEKMFPRLIRSLSRLAKKFKI